MAFGTPAAKIIFMHVANLAIQHARSTGKFSTEAVNHVLTEHFIRPDLIDELHEYVHGQIQAIDADASWEAHNEFEGAKYDMRDPTDPNAYRE